MTVGYLNGKYAPLSELQISPMDRGFLFGDGVYEVIPCYDSKMVAMSYHIERLHQSMDGIALSSPHSDAELILLLKDVVARNGGGDLGIYLQLTRGVAEKRQHAFPEQSKPTVFAYAFEISPPSDGSPETASCFKTVTRQDQRWGRCHIKSTALLGNVLHMMEAVAEDAEEVLLFNERDELTEAAACNVFVVSQDKILTPELDHQKLPGVTRRQCLELIEAHTNWPVEVRPVSRNEVMNAQEVWLSSSTKELAPVISIDGSPVGNGLPGARWSAAQKLFQQHRFSSP
ncbi:MAG: aminotransferase class IV [Congregibacter sp.]|jgi:D-alanine transaminase|nr:aminotransferase class IV [Congregibacter sp.]